MRFTIAVVFIASLACLAGPALAQSDDSIKKQIIAESLANYPGNCPCPYNTDRAGRSCGRRSAYSKPGGHSPICYLDDVTPVMIAAYKAVRSDGDLGLRE